MGAYVGIDLHRRRSLVVCLDEDGERRWWRRITNSPEALWRWWWKLARSLRW